MTMTKRFEVLTAVNYVEYRTLDLADSTLVDPTSTSQLLQGEWMRLDANGALARLAAPGATGSCLFPVVDMEGQGDIRALGSVSVPWTGVYAFRTQLYDALNAPAGVGSACYVGLIAYSGVNRMIIDNNNAAGATIMGYVTKPLSGGWLEGIRIWA